MNTGDAFSAWKLQKPLNTFLSSSSCFDVHPVKRKLFLVWFQQHKFNVNKKTSLTFLLKHFKYGKLSLDCQNVLSSLVIAEHLLYLSR